MKFLHTLYVLYKTVYAIETSMCKCFTSTENKMWDVIFDVGFARR